MLELIVFDDPRVAELDREGILMAQANSPDFVGAREAISEGMAIMQDRDPSLTGAVLNSRLVHDLGVVSIREGLYQANVPEREGPPVAQVFDEGLKAVWGAYETTAGLLRPEVIPSDEQQLLPSVKAHVAATQNTLLRATQSRQVLTGVISADKKADAVVVADQWMLGRGRTIGTEFEPGAYTNGRRGPNGYWSVQTDFLGVRAEVVNGGPLHNLKAVKWLLFRGIPELASVAVRDPKNRGAAAKTAGRLLTESVSRKRALASVVDYQRF